MENKKESLYVIDGAKLLFAHSYLLIAPAIIPWAVAPPIMDFEGPEGVNTYIAFLLYWLATVLIYDQLVQISKGREQSISLQGCYEWWREHFKSESKFSRWVLSILSSTEFYCRYLFTQPVRLGTKVVLAQLIMAMTVFLPLGFITICTEGIGCRSPLECRRQCRHGHNDHMGNLYPSPPAVRRALFQVLQRRFSLRVGQC